MPAILSLSIAAAGPLRRALSVAGGSLVRRLAQFRLVLKNRRVAADLAGLDDRMLADIGITRSDLRDAYAEPLWHDPTDVLAGRAAERRSNRRRRAFERSAGNLACGADAVRQSQANRPACYLI